MLVNMITLLGIISILYSGSIQSAKAEEPALVAVESEVDSAEKNSVKERVQADVTPAPPDAAVETEKLYTGQMIRAVFPLINKPYEKDPGDYLVEYGVTVYRPNHGIAQGARVGALTRDVVQAISLSKQKSELQDWVLGKIATDKSFTSKLALLGLNHRSGRMDESQSIENPVQRKVELTNAANNFKKSAAASGLYFTAEELETFADAIKLDGSSSPDPDRRFLSKILRGSHVLDLLRLNIKKDGDVRRFLPELSDAEVASLYKRAELYFDVTGDQRYNNGGGYLKRFFELSGSPEKLAKALEGAKGPALITHK